MKKHIIIGNPIIHSLSPKIHNYWFIKNKIKANYQKKLITEDNLKDIVKKIKEKEAACCKKGSEKEKQRSERRYLQDS